MVCEWTYKDKVRAFQLNGKEFGPTNGHRLRLKVTHDVTNCGDFLDLFISNLPLVRGHAFDPTDFEPFYEVLSPVLPRNQRRLHAGPAGATPVFCMDAQGEV
jgi:hypothetical protein